MAENKLYATDAEIAVLSIILRNPDLVYELEGLRHFMFSSSPHQALFSEIEEAMEKQIPTDPGLIIAQMEANNTISSIGGKKYIDFLVNQTPNEKTLQEWKNIVINSYKTRSLVSLGSGLNLDNINIDTVDEAINNLRKNLDNLTEVRGGTSTVFIGDIVHDVYQEIKYQMANPGLKGVSWGIESLDSATGGKCGGELWVIGARPGQGKTAFICNSVLADARKGVSSLVFQREMRANELVERLISLITGIPITNIRLRILDQKQVDKMYVALEELKKLPIYIDTSFRSTDPHYIESTIMKYKKLHDIKVVYLDYIQIVVDRTDNQTNEIGRISRLFKSLSNELNICSILISQLNRGVEQRDDKRPILSDLRQSGNLEEDADIVVGLYRDEYYNKETRFKNLMEFIILKYRNGPVGSITLKFENDTNKITGV